VPQKHREKQNNPFFQDKTLVYGLVVKNLLTTSKRLYLKCFLVFFWLNSFMAQLASKGDEIKSGGNNLN